MVAVVVWLAFLGAAFEVEVIAISSLDVTLVFIIGGTSFTTSKSELP